MCFRPTEIAMKKCPNCGKTCKPVDTKCPDCGTELDNAKKGFDADQPMGAPAPGAPSAPAAPQAPSAPKPPSA